MPFATLSRILSHNYWAIVSNGFNFANIGREIRPTSRYYEQEVHRPVVCTMFLSYVRCPKDDQRFINIVTSTRLCSLLYCHS